MIAANSFCRKLESRRLSPAALGFPRPRYFRYRRLRMSEKSLSFKAPPPPGGPGQLRRPKTLPELPSAPMIGADVEGRPRLSKLLLNVTIQGSLWAVQVLMTPDSTVADLISATLRQYVKEGRRPVLPTSDPSGFDLHYSQFSLQSLERTEKLAVLGSRNFFLCRRTAAAAGGSPASTVATVEVASCSKQAEKATKSGIGLPWLKFMGFLH